MQPVLVGRRFASIFITATLVSVALSTLHLTGEKQEEDARAAVPPAPRGVCNLDIEGRSLTPLPELLEPDIARLERFSPAGLSRWYLAEHSVMVIGGELQVQATAYSWQQSLTPVRVPASGSRLGILVTWPGGAPRWCAEVVFDVSPAGGEPSWISIARQQARATDAHGKLFSGDEVVLWPSMVEVLSRDDGTHSCLYSDGRKSITRPLTAPRFRCR